MMKRPLFDVSIRLTGLRIATRSYFFTAKVVMSKNSTQPSRVPTTPSVPSLTENMDTSRNVNVIVTLTTSWRRFDAIGKWSSSDVPTGVQKRKFSSVAMPLYTPQKTSHIWDVYCKHFGEYWPCNKGTALYLCTCLPNHSGLACQKQVSKAWISNDIPQNTVDVVIHQCPLYLLLVHKSSARQRSTNLEVVILVATIMPSPGL